MSIYRRKSGRYAVLVDLEPSATGARRRKSIGTYRTRKDAEAAERKALDARDRGIDLSPGNVTLAEVVGRFLHDAESRLAPGTVAGYSELWRVLAAPTLGAIPLGKLRAAHLQNLYADLARSPGRRGKPRSACRIHHVHRMLHRVLSWSERLGLIEHNVARHVEPPRLGPSSARALTTEEAARIISASEGTRFHPFFAVAIATGMRRGELLGLRWSDVDLDRGMLTVRQALADDHRGGYYVKPTKTNRERCVPLAPIAIDALRAVRVRQAHEKLAAGSLYEDGGFVFAGEYGQPCDLEAPTKAFTGIARRLGISGVTLHSCRHAVATWALADGADVRSVAAVLGHAAASTTLNLYGHVVAGGKERAVSVAASALAGAQERLASGANPRG